MRVTSFEHFSLAELEAYEHDHPEIGRVEIVDGNLVAGGFDMTGDRHQSVVQALHLLLAQRCPPELVIRLDTFWFGDRLRIRPDLALWRAVDRPADGGGFRVPPLAVIEVLSGNRERDLVSKRPVYEANDVAAVFIDPATRDGWWLRTPDGVDHDADAVPLALPGIGDLTLDRSIIDA